MSKLIIMIPCLNEEKTLPIALAALPETIEGIDEIELLVINDGSADKTVDVAKEHGVHHILDFKYKKGLAHAFITGILEAAKLGADYVVNFDADNQYNAGDIPKLLAPLLHEQADMVVGERFIKENANFSWLKKKLQRLGSFTIRKLAKTDIKDTPSGFRALNRHAMITLQVFNSFTYTNESLINATDLELMVVGVPIRSNPEVLRPSRLFKSTFKYIVKNGTIVLRLYLLYNPYPILIGISAIFGSAGLFLLVRFFYFYFTGEGAGWIQSLIIAGILITISLLALVMGIISDMLKVNRKLLQKNLIELREHILSLQNDKNKHHERKPEH